jgi:hypothetical protein
VLFRSVFDKGDRVSIFVCSGEDDYNMLYTIKTGQTVAIGDKVTYDFATNTIQTVTLATQMPIGTATQSGTAGNVIAVNIKTAGLGLKETITTLV